MTHPLISWAAVHGSMLLRLRAQPMLRRTAGEDSNPRIPHLVKRLVL